MANNNLPPQSQMWARDIESRLAQLELQRSNLNTLVSGTNSRMGPLVAAVGDATTSIEFLNDQISYVSNVGFSGQTVWFTTTNVSVTIPFNPAKDASLDFTTSSSGKVTIIGFVQGEIVQDGFAGPPAGTESISMSTSYYIYPKVSPGAFPVANETFAWLATQPKYQYLGVFPPFASSSSRDWIYGQGFSYTESLSPNTQYNLTTGRNYYGYLSSGTAPYMLSSSIYSLVAITHK